VISLELEYLAKTNNLIKNKLSLLHQHAHDDPENISRAIAAYLCVSDSAKRVRPLICLYYHWLFQEDAPDSLLNIGVAAEFIHAASLLHDDVVDESSKRRGRSSANVIFGNAQAVLGGNFLSTQAFDLLRSFPRDFLDQATIVIREMTLAAILEISMRGQLDTSQNAWRQVASGKTGILFSWCGFASAVNAGRPEQAMKLWQVGPHIGQVFQMADDLKDFSGDQNLKDICRDLRNRDPSLPILLAADSNPKNFNIFKTKFSQAELDDQEVNYLRDLIFESGAIDKTYKLMHDKLELIIKMLYDFGDSRGRIFLEKWALELISLR